MSFQIIVVDDQEIDRYLVERIAAKWGKGARVVGFGDPREAVEVLCDPQKLQASCLVSTRPIVVLLDINMPHMTGFDVLSELEKRLAGDSRNELLFVMMFTSSHNDEDQKRAQSFSLVRDYIVKPLETKHLDQVQVLHAQIQSELGLN